jgi:hypothetical protein
MPTIPTQLRAALDAQNLTLYGASLIVGAETDEGIKTVHRRITSYTSDRPPKSIAQLEQTLDALGLQLTITPSPNRKQSQPKESVMATAYLLKDPTGDLYLVSPENMPPEMSGAPAIHSTYLGLLPQGLTPYLDSESPVPEEIA